MRPSQSPASIRRSCRSHPSYRTPRGSSGSPEDEDEEDLSSWLPRRPCRLIKNGRTRFGPKPPTPGRLQLYCDLDIDLVGHSTQRGVIVILIMLLG